MIVLSSMALALLLSANHAPRSPAHDSRWLSTIQLQRLLTGTRVSQPDRSRGYMRNPEEFRRSGSYVRHEDNFEARGTYRFRAGRICVTAERDPETCRRMMIDKKGNYWMEGLHNLKALERVSIEALR